MQTGNIPLNIRYLFIGSVVLLFGLALISYERMNFLIRASEWVNHTTRVNLELERTISTLKDAGTYKRGYLFTHEPRFLQKFDTIMKDYPAHLLMLRQLEADNPEQQKNLEAVETLAKKGEDYMLYGLQVDSIGVSTAANMRTGVMLLDSLRTAIDHMLTVENDLMKERNENLKKQEIVTPIFLFLLLVASITIVTVSFFRVNNELQKSTQLAESLTAANKQISETNNLFELKNTELERMNRELGSFAYIASHDLQEPLRKIQIFSTHILEQEASNLSDKGKDYFQRMQSATDRMRQLIEDLLTYSRADAGEKQFKKTDLNVLLVEVREQLAERIAASGALIESEKLPVLKVVPFQIQQLFTNLISNAIKFAKPGEAPHIVIKIRRKDSTEMKNSLSTKNFHHLTFTDNGIGFEPEYNEKIFGLFQRLHPRHVYDGTGIGLAICKKIVENHGGMVTAEGAPDKGATFHIYLPET